MKSTALFSLKLAQIISAIILVIGLLGFVIMPSPPSALFVLIGLLGLITTTILRWMRRD